MEICETISRLCKEKGISISRLEKELSFANGSIRRWNESSPSVDKLEKVADYFNVTTDYLLGRTDKSSNEMLESKVDEIWELIKQGEEDDMETPERKTTIGKRIKLRREQKNIDAEVLADMVGVSKLTLKLYELGISKPSYSSLTEIANILNTSTDYLLGRTDDPFDIAGVPFMPDVSEDEKAMAIAEMKYLLKSKKKD